MIRFFLLCLGVLFLTGCDNDRRFFENWFSQDPYNTLISLNSALI